MHESRTENAQPGDRVYRGARGGIVTVDGMKLDPRLDLANHSPTGFMWGYGGSGPAQLALAILCDHLGDDRRALKAYQTFKFRVIAQIPMNESWTMTSEQVQQQVDAIEAEIDPGAAPS